MNRINAKRAGDILLTVFGAILLFWPGGTLVVVSQLTGWILIASGAVAIISSITGRNTGWYVLGGGIVGLVLGAVIITHPRVMVSVIPVIIGAAILAWGIYRIVQAQKTRNLVGNRYAVDMTIAVLMVVLGAAILFNPFSAAGFVVRLIGITLLICGISGLVTPRM